MLDNVPDFQPNEKPSSAKMNSLRDAIAALLSGGITGSMIAWPLQAEGPLDMNGNYILNAASTDGAIHVNSSKTFDSAVSDVNAAGGGTIIIDSGYVAAAPVTGVTITASNVRVYGQGPDSGLLLGSNSQFGMIVDGDFFFMDNLVVTTNADTATFDAAICLRGYHQHIDKVVFDANTAASIYLGDASNTADYSKVTNCVFAVTAETAVVVRNARRFSVSGNKNEDSGAFVVFPLGTTIATNGLIEQNIIDAVGNDGIVSDAAAAPGLSAVIVRDNILVCTGGTAFNMSGFSDGQVHFGYTDGDVVIGGDNNLFANLRGVPSVTAVDAVDCVLHNLAVPDSFAFSGTSTGNKIVLCAFASNVTIAAGECALFFMNYVGGDTTGIAECTVYGFNDVIGSES